MVREKEKQNRIKRKVRKASGKVAAGRMMKKKRKGKLKKERKQKPKQQKRAGKVRK